MRTLHRAPDVGAWLQLALTSQLCFPINLKTMLLWRLRCTADAEEELDDAFARASNEAKAAFGNGSMFAEKYAPSLVLGQNIRPFILLNSLR